MGDVFVSQEQFEQYVATHFPEVTQELLKGRIIKFCPGCNTKIGFEILESRFNYEGSSNFSHPYSKVIECPECSRGAIWVLYNVRNADQKTSRTYRLVALPGESAHDIAELPSNPPALRKAYHEAIRSLEANNPMAAAAMFRRALQVITREILGVNPGKLAIELKSLMGKTNKLGITLSEDFHENSYIIKEVANQATHPDGDIDLIDLTQEDAQNLYELFLELVGELFVIPTAKEQARRELLARRKVMLPSSGTVEGRLQ